MPRVLLHRARAKVAWRSSYISKERRQADAVFDGHAMPGFLESVMAYLMIAAIA
jgi:hypothetical protein